MGEMMADESNPVSAQVGGNQVDNLDLEAIKQIRVILNEFYPDVRKALLEYCLFITDKDLEA